MLLELSVSMLLLLGAAFTLLGSIGLLRMPDFLTRLHAPTKATTLGVGSMLLASMLHFAGRGQAGLHELLIVLLLFMSAPVSAQLLALAALQLERRRQGQDGTSAGRSTVAPAVLPLPVGGDAPIIPPAPATNQRGQTPPHPT